MIYLKQSTAATIKLGPFVDATDGVTAETGLTIQKADVRLSKNGGNMAAAAADQGESDAGAAHDELGYYDISLGTGDTDTVGRLKVMVSESGALPVWAEYEVVPANVFDSIVAGTDLLDANASQLGGTAQTGRDIGASVLLDSAYDAAKIGAGPVFAVNPPIEHSSTSNILRLYIAAKSGSGGYNSLAYNTANLSIAVRPSNDEGTPPKFMYDSGDSEIEAISAIGTYQAPSAGCCRFGFASPSGCYELHLADAVFAEAGATGLTVYVSGGADWQESLLEVPLVGYDPQNVAEAGDEMALISAYDAAKTAAQAGDEMDLVDAPNGTAVTAIQSGLSTHSAADAAAAVWAIATSTLTSAGTIGKLLVDKMGQLLGTIAAGTHSAQSGDAYGVVTNATYGNAAIKTETALIYDDTDELQKNQGNWLTATGFSTHSAADAATAVWAALTSGLTTAGSIGKYLLDHIVGILLTGNHNAQSGDAYAEIGEAGANLTVLATSSQAESISQEITAIKGETWTDETLVTIQTAAEAATAPTVEEIDTQLSTTHGAGTWGGAAGSGPNYRELKFYADVGKTVPIPSVKVTLHPDSACATPNVYGPVFSDALGVTAWHLDAGTYYMLAQHKDYSFDIAEITVP